MNKTGTPLWHLIFVAGDFIFAGAIFLLFLLAFWMFN
jgi:hypothetical protein